MLDRGALLLCAHQSTRLLLDSWYIFIYQLFKLVGRSSTNIYTSSVFESFGTVARSAGALDATLVTPPVSGVACVGVACGLWRTGALRSERLWRAMRARKGP